jgi:molybdopterin/thiamine biosynthesis adenylyltransferase
MLPAATELFYEKTCRMPPLSQKTALVVGAGGLGAPALLVLGAAGVGRVLVVDAAAVERSDLARHPLLGDADVGARKAEVTARRLSRLYPAVAFDALDQRFAPENAVDLCGRADVIVDASDGFDTKFLASDAAVAARRPLVHGGLLRYTAQILTVLPGVSGCVRCLFEAPPPAGAVPTRTEAGVLGALAGFAGSLLGSEAVRLLLGERGAHAGRLLVYEARGARARAVPIRRRPLCPTCATVTAPAEAVTS